MDQGGRVRIFWGEESSGFPRFSGNVGADGAGGGRGWTSQDLHRHDDGTVDPLG